MIYNNECILVSIKKDSSCGSYDKDSKYFEFKLPEKIHTTEDELKLMNIRKDENILMKGPSSSISGMLFKV